MKQTALSLLVIILLVMPSMVKATEKGLMLYFPFEEGSGDTAVDASGNGNDGVIKGGAKWVASMKNFGKALQFNGSDVDVRAPHIPLDNRSFTIMMWVNPILYTDQQLVFSQKQSNATNLSMHFRLGGPGAGAAAPVGGIRMGFYSNDLDSPAGIIEDNTWYHLTFWYDFENKTRRIYVNGEKVAEDVGKSPFLGTSGDTVVGSWTSDGQYFKGIIDEVRIYDHPLAEDEIQNIMKGLGSAVYPKDKLSITWGTIKQSP